jgi:hypothetical protein
MSNKEPFGNYIDILALCVLKIIEVESNILVLLNILFITRQFSYTLQQLLSLEI